MNKSFNQISILPIQTFVLIKSECIFNILKVSQESFPYVLTDLEQTSVKQIEKSNKWKIKSLQTLRASMYFKQIPCRSDIVKLRHYSCDFLLLIQFYGENLSGNLNEFIQFSTFRKTILDCDFNGIHLFTNFESALLAFKLN